MVLNAEPLCRHCMAEGRVQQAQEVDHIDGNAWNLAWDNLQPLCKSCHSKKTAKEHGWVKRPKYMFRVDEPPLMPVTIICGPPGAGKTAYAESKAGKQDLVIDLDAIKARETKTDLYQRQDEEARDIALYKRNEMLTDLGRHRGYKHVYFITMGSTAEERNFWCSNLRTKDVVLLDPGKDECIKRIQNDSRRSEEAKRNHVAAVHDWYGKRD